MKLLRYTIWGARPPCAIRECVTKEVPVCYDCIGKLRILGINHVCSGPADERDDCFFCHVDASTRRGLTAIRGGR